MEERVQEELGHLNAAIQAQGGKAFDIRVSAQSCLFTICKTREATTLGLN